MSRIGYATSRDGFHIDYRADEPVFCDTACEQCGNGASPGGAEDPRATLVGDLLVMFYVAYDGRNPPFLAMTSIAKNEFLARRWSAWAKPQAMSQPGLIGKPGVVFPEKINGKYCIMHRVFPHIEIDYRDSLDFESLERDHFKVDAHFTACPPGWESWKTGVGAPPIRTSEGWLLIYASVDHRSARDYGIGAMLLDLDDPSKVIVRTRAPVLEPHEWYETAGFKPFMAFPCGAVVKKPNPDSRDENEHTLTVYYGAAGNYVAAAKQNLGDFLEQLLAQA